MEDFQINEYLPLRDVVFETLRQKILKGELKPGELFDRGSTCTASWCKSYTG